MLPVKRRFDKQKALMQVMVFFFIRSPDQCPLSDRFLSYCFIKFCIDKYRFGYGTTIDELFYNLIREKLELILPITHPGSRKL